MFCITHQERKVLLFIGTLILLGSLLRFFRPTEENITLKSEDYKLEEVTKKKININLAESKDLENLPGVGSVIANRIVEYRIKKGFFTSLNDLKRVKGIGDKKGQRIEEYISFN